MRIVESVHAPTSSVLRGSEGWGWTWKPHIEAPGEKRWMQDAELEVGEVDVEVGGPLAGEGEGRDQTLSERSPDVEISLSVLSF